MAGTVWFRSIRRSGLEKRAAERSWVNIALCAMVYVLPFWVILLVHLRYKTDGLQLLCCTRNLSHQRVYHIPDSGIVDYLLVWVLTGVNKVDRNWELFHRHF